MKGTFIIVLICEELVVAFLSFFFFHFLSPLSSLQGQAGAGLLLLNLDLELYRAGLVSPCFHFLKQEGRPQLGSCGETRSCSAGPGGNASRWKLLDVPAKEEGPDSESFFAWLNPVIPLTPPAHLWGLQRARSGTAGVGWIMGGGSRPLGVQIPVLALSSCVVWGREQLLGFLVASVSPPVKWAS